MLELQYRDKRFAWRFFYMIYDIKAIDVHRHWTYGHPLEPAQGSSKNDVDSIKEMADMANIEAVFVSPYVAVIGDNRDEEIIESNERLAELARKAEEEKAAAEAAAKRIAGAFGKGTQMGSKGTGDTGQGMQGSPTGNAAEGKSSGVGGYGTFDLNGRSLGPGGLPMPVYNVQEEGRVVVTITVNPAGQVIQTNINKRTNTANAALRKAAEDAARKARFNSVDGVNNQTGTITYYFKLK